MIDRASAEDGPVCPAADFEGGEDFPRLCHRRIERVVLDQLAQELYRQDDRGIGGTARHVCGLVRR